MTSCKVEFEVELSLFLEDIDEDEKVSFYTFIFDSSYVCVNSLPYALLFARFIQKLRQVSMLSSSLPTFFKILEPNKFLFTNSYKVSIKLALYSILGE